MPKEKDLFGDVPATAPTSPDEDNLAASAPSSDTASQPISDAPTDEYPNRKAFAGRFAKRHKDIDFEDKEARYGALNDDSDRLDRYEESGKSLSNVFEKHRWMASMFEALREDESLDPITWMADNGIDIEEALSSEEYRKGISDRIKAFQKQQIEGEKAAKEREKNLTKSAKALSSLGLSDEENLEMWNHLFNEVIDPALRGEISKETWQLVQKARNYDSDMQKASDTAAMKARNEKIRNQSRQVKADVPPSLPQAASGIPETKPKTQSPAAQFFGE